MEPIPTFQKLFMNVYIVNDFYNVNLGCKIRW